jgi:hypothetical protein
MWAYYSKQLPVLTGVGKVTIDMLPDIALLEIFDLYVAQFTFPPIYNRDVSQGWCTPCVENGERSFLAHHVA